MTTLLVTHPACLDHLTPPGHPERPDRLRAIERVLENERFQALVREQAPAATLDLITLCHPRDYAEEIRNANPSQGMVRLDADTSMSPGTFEAVLRAVGGATTPRPCGRWASASSTPPQLSPATPRKSTAPSASP